MVGVSVSQDEKSMEMDSGDGCTKLCIYFIPLKMVKMVNILCILP